MMVAAAVVGALVVIGIAIALAAGGGGESKVSVPAASATRPPGTTNATVLANVAFSVQGTIVDVFGPAENLAQQRAAIGTRVTFTLTPLDGCTASSCRVILSEGLFAVPALGGVYQLSGQNGQLHGERQIAAPLTCAGGGTAQNVPGRVSIDASLVPGSNTLSGNAEIRPLVETVTLSDGKPCNVYGVRVSFTGSR
jgi:hypothetical protein